MFFDYENFDMEECVEALEEIYIDSVNAELDIAFAEDKDKY